MVKLLVNYDHTVGELIVLLGQSPSAAVTKTIRRDDVSVGLGADLFSPVFVQLRNADAHGADFQKLREYAIKHAPAPADLGLLIHKHMQTLLENSLLEYYRKTGKHSLEAKTPEELQVCIEAA